MLQALTNMICKIMLDGKSSIFKYVQQNIKYITTYIHVIYVMLKFNRKMQ